MAPREQHSVVYWELTLRFGRPLREFNASILWILLDVQN